MARILVRGSLVPCLLASAVLGLAAERADAGSIAYFNAAAEGGGLGTGTLDGVGFTTTVTSGAVVSRSAAYLGTAAHDSIGVVNYLRYAGTTVTIVFDEAVTDLELYVYNWGGGHHADGAEQYTFSQDFTLNADFANGSHLGEADNILTVPRNDANPALRGNGILSFAGPITSLSWTAYDWGIESYEEVVTGEQGFLFSGSAAGSGSPVPGPAGAAAMLGLAVAARRRRR